MFKMSRSKIDFKKMTFSRQYGIICDLDGTLYRNDLLQSKFEDEFLACVSKELNIGLSESKDVLAKARSRLQSKNKMLPSEFRVLKALGISPMKWLKYSEQQVEPKLYLETDPNLISAISSIRRVAFFDVTTNSSYELARRILGCLGLVEEIDGLWTPDRNFSIMGKPSTALYKNIARIHGLIPSNVLVIGDRWHIDVVSAKSLNMRYVLVNGPEQTKAEIQEFAERISEST